MGTVNGRTLDNCKRTLFYRQNANGVLVRLPFSIVTIDEDQQFWEPMSYLGVSPKGERLAGSNHDQVILPRNMALPRPPAGQNPDKYAAWLYYGV
jgi:hypothetical protein